MSIRKATTPPGRVASPPPEAASRADDDVFRVVPPSQRQSWLGFLAILCGAWASLAAVSVGAQAGLELTAWKTSLAFLVGYLIAMILAMLIAEIGRRERVSTAVLCMGPFSKYGAGIPGLLIFVTGAISVGIQVDILVRVIFAMTGVHIGDGFSLTRGVTSAAFTAVMMWSSYMGIKYIKYVSWVTIPIFFTVLIVGVVTVTAHSPSSFSQILTHGANATTFTAVMVTGMSLYAGFAVLMADISRFVESRKGLMAGLAIGFTASAFVPAAGAYLGASSRAGAGSAAAYWVSFTTFGPAVIVFAAIGFFLAQWSTNDSNAFQAGLGFSTFLRVLPASDSSRHGLNRRGATLGVGLIAVVLAFIGAGSVGFIAGFVGYLGVTFLPLGGILVAHYYIIERRGRRVRTTGIAGFGALAISVTIGVLGWVNIPFVTPVIGAIVLYCAIYYGIERPLLGERRYHGSVSEVMQAASPQPEP